jgi:hypothetical protein
MYPYHAPKNRGMAAWKGGATASRRRRRRTSSNRATRN